jgi:hypothetical protein
MKNAESQISMKVSHFTFLLLLLFFICGCSNPEKKALNSFKPIVTFLSSQTNSDGKIEYSDLSYDVEKTDSLISPFTGIVVFHEGNSIFTCHFALQNDKWVHKSIDSSLDTKLQQEEMTRMDEDTNIISDEVREKNKSQVIELEQMTARFQKSNLDRDLSKFLGCPQISNF